MGMDALEKDSLIMGEPLMASLVLLGLQPKEHQSKRVRHPVMKTEMAKTQRVMEDLLMMRLLAMQLKRQLVVRRLAAHPATVMINDLYHAWVRSRMKK